MCFPGGGGGEGVRPSLGLRVGRGGGGGLVEG